MDILAYHKSKYQDIMIVDEGAAQIGLILDGNYQTPLPNNGYYGILLGGNFGMKTAILGGGDLTSLPVLKHRKITDFTIYEIDKDVVTMCSPFSQHTDMLEGHIEYCDAIEKLRDKDFEVEHIAIDLLGMSRLDVLVNVKTDEFIDLICTRATKYITGYVASGLAGIYLGARLKQELVRRGWTDYTFAVNEMTEVFFAVSRGDVPWPDHLEKYAIRYAIYDKDSRIAREPFDNVVEIAEYVR